MLLPLKGLASDEPLEVEVDLLPLSDAQGDANAPRFVTVRAIKEAVSRKHAANKVDGSGRAVWQPRQLCELFAAPEAAAQLGIDVSPGRSTTEPRTYLDRLIMSLKKIVDETTEQAHSAGAGGDGCAEPDTECHNECEAVLDPSTALATLSDEEQMLDAGLCSSLGLRRRAIPLTANSYYDAFRRLRSILEWYGPVLTWDVHKVGSLTRLFARNGAKYVYRPEFAKTVVGFGFSGWNVSGATDMHLMFSGASFPPEHGWGSSAFDLSAWDVSSVTFMSRMFVGARGFTGKGIEVWDVSACVDFRHMFHDCEDFNADLSAWGALIVLPPGDKNDVDEWDGLRAADHRECRNEAASGGEVDSSEVVSKAGAGCRTKLKRARNLKGMFENCEKLEPENIPKWDLSTLDLDQLRKKKDAKYRIEGIFKGCTTLRRAGIFWPGDVSRSTVDMSGVNACDR
eukprot:g10277.t1